GTGRCQAGTPHDVVEAAFEELEQVVAGDSGAAGRLLVVATELTLQHPVHHAQLLLLAQLDLVVALADSAAAVLTGRVRTTIDRAFLGLAQRGTCPPARLVL